MGTIRSLNPETHQILCTRTKEVVETIANSFHVEAEFVFLESYPALINDRGAAKLVEQVGRDQFGEENVVTNPPASMGGEDFAFFAQQVPSAMFRLGIRPRDKTSIPKLHHPQFDFGDEPIEHGIAMHSLIAEKYLHQGLNGNP